MTGWMIMLLAFAVIMGVSALLLWAGYVFATRILKEQRRVIDKVTNKDLEQRLQREGVATTAWIVDAADTRGRVDAIFIMTRLQLLVAAAEGVEEFETEIVAPLSPVRLAQFAPGTTVKVRVDPVTREVVLDQPRQ